MQNSKVRRLIRPLDLASVKDLIIVVPFYSLNVKKNSVRLRQSRYFYVKKANKYIQNATG